MKSTEHLIRALTETAKRVGEQTVVLRAQEREIAELSKRPPLGPPAAPQEKGFRPDDVVRLFNLLKTTEDPARCNGFIDAIKLVRACTGKGLKESKDFVETLLGRAA